MLVRYYGHVGVASGYGDAANETCMAILKAGLDLEISTDGAALDGRYLPLANRIMDEAKMALPDVVVVHTLPLSAGQLLRHVRTACPRALAVVYTTWEGASPVSPAFLSAVSQYDAVWVPCASNAAAVQDAGGQAAAVVPHANSTLYGGPWPRNPACACGLHHTTDPAFRQTRVVTPGGPGTVHNLNVAPMEAAGSLSATVRLDSGGMREYRMCALGWPRPADVPFRFYYIGAWNVRKNPEGVIRAYVRAFTRGDNVELRIHAVGAAVDAVRLAELATGVAWPPRITLTTERLSDIDVHMIHRNMDCFVSASRGEAWNIPAFDAMMAGRHIIVPRGLGSDDFLEGTTAERYASRLSPASGEVRVRSVSGDGMVTATYFGAQGLDVKSSWREPDISQLAVLMRRAYVENRFYLRGATYDPVERYSRETIGAHIRSLLEGALHERSTAV